VIIEHALLHVRAGKESEFEAAMAEAKPLIAASPGFIDIKVCPAVDFAGTYLLMVSWNSVADHRDGFRKSSKYEQWRGLLHHFYDPMPEVGYFGDPL
jgi:heme-degrading monooxygenase HmoA